MTVMIECISWLIKVADNNDAWWKTEINLHNTFLLLFPNSAVASPHELNSRLEFTTDMYP
jgi:hypothetical protein